MPLKGTQTEKNLLTAFAGESQARNRYSFAAGQARKDGFEQIAAIFEETADHERQHAKRLFKFLEGGEVTIEAAFPAGVIGSTHENLLAAAAGEHYENTEMYPGFAKVARAEGFENIARVFESIARAEKYHEQRYLALADNVKAERVFRRDKPAVWKCRKCGYLHEGPEPPAACPACTHARTYFELLVENY